MGKPWIQCLCTILTVAFACVALTPDRLKAQDLDLSPPIINLQSVDSGQGGEVQVFTAEILEDRQLLSSVLFHKFAGDDRFNSTEMLRIEETDIYSASVVTDYSDVRDIHYYIEAEDGAGNKSIKGFVFDPLIRRMLPAEVINAREESGPAISGKMGIILGVIGVVALAALAGADSGGDSGGSTQTTPLTVIARPPQ